MTMSTKKVRPKTRGRPRKAQRPNDMRETLLDAAERLFAERGVYGVTIKELAQQTGVDTALLHYYFDDKQGVLNSVFQRRAVALNAHRIEMLERYEKEFQGRMT